jgi:hypothetical protein
VAEGKYPAERGGPAEGELTVGGEAGRRIAASQVRGVPGREAGQGVGGTMDCSDDGPCPQVSTGSEREGVLGRAGGGRAWREVLRQTQAVEDLSCLVEVGDESSDTHAASAPVALEHIGSN